MKVPHNTPAAQNEITLDSLTERIAEELAHLTQLALDVQDGMSACITSCPPDLASMSQLQSIDRIGQGLAVLGRLIAGLTDDLPHDVTLRTESLRRDFRLFELTDRLIHPCGEPRPASSRTCGDVVWF